MALKIKIISGHQAESVAKQIETFVEQGWNLKGDLIVTEVPLHPRCTATPTVNLVVEGSETDAVSYIHLNSFPRYTQTLVKEISVK